MSITQNMSHAEIVAQFWGAPDDALFGQKPLSVVLGFSEKWFESRRWRGGGIRFLKLSSRVMYRKSDVLIWLAKQNPTHSTTEYQQEVRDVI